MKVSRKIVNSLFVRILFFSLPLLSIACSGGGVPTSEDSSGNLERISSKDGGESGESPGADLPQNGCQSDADCQDPAKPWCLNGTCSSQKPCAKDEDCSDPTPKCVNGVCDALPPECQTDGDCSDPNKVCKDGKCEPKGTECFQNADCKDPAKPLCKSGQCSEPECRGDSDCKDPTKPLCKDFICTAECSDDGDCQNGMLCISARCRPKGLFCRDDSHCPAGKVCDNGQCIEKGSCKSDSDCQNGQVCQKGKCVDLKCQKDSDCQPGEVCRAGKCVLGGNCKSDSDCPAGKICKNGTCIQECAKDSDCKDPKRPICKSGKCVAKSPCKTDRDCQDPVRKICNPLDGQCYQCLNDSHCPSDKYCEPKSFTCVPRTTKCKGDSDCKDPTKPFCLKSGVCAECLSDKNCKKFQACQKNRCVYVGCKSDAECAPQFCELKTGKCRECLKDTHCKPNQKCDLKTYTCKQSGCKTDRDCKVPVPACLKGKCVECTDAKKHCPKNYLCKNNKCVNCQKDSDCKAFNPSPPYAYRSTQICLANKCQNGCRRDSDCSLGYICKKNICEKGCRSNRDCPQSSVCKNNQCVKVCRSRYDCYRQRDRRVCDTKSGVCVQCLSSRECQIYYGRDFASRKPVCNLKEKRCGCWKSSDCRTTFPNSVQPTCDLKKNECVECTKDVHCRRGLICSKNKCIAGCRSDRDCPRGKYCNLKNNQCVECTSDKHCKGGVCNSLNRCVECLRDRDCKAGYICDTVNNTCYQKGKKQICQTCKSSKDCSAGLKCISLNHRDVRGRIVKETVCSKPCRSDQDCPRGFACSKRVGRNTFCWPNYFVYSNFSYTRSCRALFDIGKKCQGFRDYNSCGLKNVRDIVCSTLEKNICRILCQRDEQCPSKYKCECPPGYQKRVYSSGTIACSNGRRSTFARCR